MCTSKPDSDSVWPQLRPTERSFVHFQRIRIVLSREALLSVYPSTGVPPSASLIAKIENFVVDIASEIAQEQTADIYTSLYETTLQKHCYTFQCPFRGFSDHLKQGVCGSEIKVSLNLIKLFLQFALCAQKSSIFLSLF